MNVDSDPVNANDLSADVYADDAYVINGNAENVNANNFKADGLYADVEYIDNDSDVNSVNNVVYMNGEPQNADNWNTDHADSEDVLADAEKANDIQIENETTPKASQSSRTDNKCVTCFRRFPTAVQLRLHLVGARHKSVIKTEHQCSDCGKYFKVG